MIDINLMSEQKSEMYINFGNEIVCLYSNKNLKISTDIFNGFDCDIFFSKAVFQYPFYHFKFKIICFSLYMKTQNGGTLLTNSIIQRELI